ncbi:MAG: hypothetical protein HYT83_02075 [Candidatus Levybacteria bacterium]|nr:hypothetical protein [Candidatus Levybacteria bacterium]
MQRPDYDLSKIKFATDQPTFEKAVVLYESGKVTQFEEGIRSYAAVVLGTKPYRVSVEARRYDYGHCNCYLGQSDTLCKHMVALALFVVMYGKPLTDEDKKLIDSPSCSGKLGKLEKEELAVIKKSFTEALRYIKGYNGPSRTWFAYQNSLQEGCKRLSAIVSNLPVNEQTTQLLVDLLLRLDKKLISGGVDDSDGTVGEFIRETVEVLIQYTKLDPKCTPTFRQLENRETCFGWEKPLLELISDKHDDIISP